MYKFISLFSLLNAKKKEKQVAILSEIEIILLK
jgi:hypothetical protein